MARFEPEQHDNDVSASRAWARLTELIKDGAKTVEVLSRVVDGKPTWELRAWDGIRKDRSNAVRASSTEDY